MDVWSRQLAQRILITVLLLGAVATPGAAATPIHWTTVGPRGGSVSNLVPAQGGAGILWTAIPNQGIAKSIDGGASWFPTPLAEPRSYFGVVADPNDPLTAYAEGATGLAKTTDGGATWRVIRAAQYGILAIRPGNPSTLYLIDGQTSASRLAAARSDDGGATWRSLPPLPSVATWIHSASVDPSNPDNVFAFGYFATTDPAPLVLHSTDGGEHWSMEPALPFDLQSVRWDPRIPGRALSVVGFGLVRSTNGGTTWEIVNTDLPGGLFFFDVLPDPAAGGFYLSTYELFPGTDPATRNRLWRSADGGTSWTLLSERPGLFSALALDGAIPGRLYAGAAPEGSGSVEGLLTSGDGGRHWQAAGAGFVPLPARDVAADPHAAGTFLAVLSLPRTNDLARSTDGGATWERWSPRTTDSAPAYLTDLVFDPFVAGSIFSTTGSLFEHSTDGGRTWAVTRPFPPDFAGTTSLVPDPLHPGVLFAAGPKSTGSESLVLKSGDGGATWSVLLSLGGFLPTLNEILIDPRPPFTLYAAGRAAFWKSVDGGATWASVAGGLPQGDDFSVRALATGGDGSLYAWFNASPGGRSLYKSGDRGVSWAALDPGPPAGLSLYGFQAFGATLYAATNTGVYTSTDGGAHWTAASDGLAQPVAYQLAGAPDGGLVVATDGGLAVSPAPAHSCQPGQPGNTALCLGGGRFTLGVRWSLPDGTAGDAKVAPLTGESGGFWFFSPQSLELVVKVLDGRTVNEHFWVFGGALSDVAYTLTVTDEVTGAVRTYANPQGRLTSFADTGAFTARQAGAGAVSKRWEGRLSAATAASACTPSADTLCLGGARFAVQVTWQLPAGGGTATAVPLLQDTGAFWFFAPGNPELLVKILDGRAVNGHFWVFFAGLSGVASTVTVTDTTTGVTKVYSHPAGDLASTADTSF